MAQVAHFTATSQNRPSIFEVIAQNALNETLHPALHRLSQFLANNFPDKFAWLYDYYDEAFLMLNGALQYCYLMKYDASFAESFYGLKRVTIDNEKLNDKQRWLCLITLTLLPYVQQKLQETISMYRLQKAEGSLKSNFKKSLLLAHSTLHLTWGTWMITNYIRYMSQRTPSQLPIVRLLNLQLVYSDQTADADFWSALFKGRLTPSEMTSGLLKNTVGLALETAAFFVQFLQAWNKERPNYNPAALPVVPPPTIGENGEKFKGKCPICTQNWRIPTVLPVSGFVFCFACILRYLRENRKCPVTWLPAKPLDIIRLYD